MSMKIIKIMYHQGKILTKNRKYVVPQLIDNKRRHLEKRLSSARRDKLLLDKSKEDAQFRRDLAAVMRESTVSFTASMKNIGSYISRFIYKLAQLK